MQRGDKRLTPLVDFTDTKANIEAITNPVEGMCAQQTDSPYAQGRYANGAWVWGGAGGGAVDSVVAGDNITVDDTDPANPIVSATDGYIPPATTAENDFQVGDGLGAWIKKTLVEVATILRTVLDLVYAPISHGSHIPAAGAATQLLQWASSGVAKWITLSGDATIANGGAVAVNKTRLNVRNETGTTIATTKAVYVSGFNNLPLVTLATNVTELAHNVIGITVGAIAHEANGYIATGGQFDAETDGWAVGTELYLTTAGALTATAPTSGSIIHVAIVTVQANYPTGKLLIYHYPEENYLAGGAGVDTIIRMGDAVGANKTSFRDYANVEVAGVNSDGAFTATSFNGMTAAQVTDLTDGGITTLHSHAGGTVSPTLLIYMNSNFS